MNKNNISQEELEEIERFLNKELSEEDHSVFEEKMMIDNSFSEKVEEIRVLIQVVEEDGLSKQMEAIHKKNFASNNIEVEASNVATEDKVVSINSNKSLYRKFAFAASIALLVGLGTYLFNNATSEHEQLFATHFTQDPGLVTPMSATDNYEFYRGMVDYKQEKYALAITRWQKLLIEKPTNDSLNYYIGVSKLTQGEVEKSLSYFEKIEAKSFFYNDALLYLGLINLKQGNIESAKLYFEKNNSIKAKEILNQINQE